MNQTSQPDRNRRLDPRRPPRCRIKVICQRGTMELGRNLGKTVLDLSPTGVRLLVCEALRPGEEVSLTLESIASVQPIKRLGCVAWCEAASEGAYAAGIRFEKRLEYRQFLDLT